MPVPLVIAAGAAAAAVAGVVGWKSRGAVDEITGEVNTAAGTINTFQLILIAGIIYGGYRFVKGFK